MLLTINQNEAVTMVSLIPGKTFFKKKKVEKDTEYNFIKGNKDHESILICKNSFSIITPYYYRFVVKRVDNLTNTYEETYNISQLEHWLDTGSGAFIIENVNIFLDDKTMQITVQVSHDSSVTLDTETSTEELEFDDSIMLA